MLNMLEFGMDPQAALDAPRFCIGAHSFGSEISLEDG
jgi:gamma-glutamyltranspeptidase/glutathione hydrolase